MVDHAEPDVPVAEDQAGLREGLGRVVADRRRLVISIVVGLLLAAGVILMIGKASGFAKLTNRLAEAHAGWLILALLAEGVSIGGYVAAFRGMVALGGKINLGKGVTLHVVLASLGATRLLAAAGAGGLAVNYWALRRLGFAARDSVVQVLVLNTVLYAMFGLAGLTSAVVLLVTSSAPLGVTVPWIAVVGGCAVAAAWVTRPGRAERFAADPGPREQGGKVLNLLHRGAASAVAAVLATRTVFGSPRAHRGLLGGAAAYWLGDIACLWLSLRAFGVEVGLATVVLGYATGYVANVLPLPTGGVGGVDAAMTFALNALGVPLEDALAGVIAYRFIGFWLPTIPAIVALVRLPQLGRALAKVASERVS
jgi:uncharacterized membrane protein YbhN (UPF0104 family)